MKAAVALLLLSVVAVSAYTELEYQNLFTRWMLQNDKTYQHEEFFHRYNTFRSNLDLINESNNANKSYTLTMNKFGDLTTEEFGKTFCGYRPELRIDATFVNENAVEAPITDDDIDWTTQGAVTPIKDQGQCGSCWAFSATGAIEGAVYVSSKVLTSVAEQQLVDCAGAQGNQGCNGGLMDYAFDYVIANGGIGSEASYKYTARDGTCKKVPSVSQIKGYTDLDKTEAALSAALNDSPVSIAIEADQPCFQFYHSGVLDDRSCGTSLDHGVLLVGRGAKDASTGKAFWRVKNSWGVSWGDKGFIKFVQGKNQCGMTLAATSVQA